MGARHPDPRADRDGAQEAVSGLGTEIHEGMRGERKGLREGRPDREGGDRTRGHPVGGVHRLRGREAESINELRSIHPE